MKNKEVFDLREALKEVDYIRGKSFAYAVLKNKELLDKEIEVINKLKKEPHPDYINYENERQLLCQVHCEKDDNDQPVLQHNLDGTQAFKIGDMVKFQEEFAPVAEKYKEVLEDMQTSKNDYDEFLEKESTIELNKVTFNDLPEDVTAVILEKIKYMID